MFSRLYCVARQAKGGLIHFLNSILSPKIPITSGEIHNPYNERTYLTEKLSIVDLKAKDSAGITYQVEVQLSTPGHPPNRMLYTWSSIYQRQMVKGDEYHNLKPVISIWLLTKNRFDHSPDCYHHHLQVGDLKTQTVLTDDLSIHVLALPTWHKPETLQASDYWLNSFKGANKVMGLLTSERKSRIMGQRPHCYLRCNIVTPLVAYLIKPY